MFTKNLRLVSTLLVFFGLTDACWVPAEAFTNLHSFTTTGFPNYTNIDGANPYDSLILSGKTLYGTAIDGGSSGKGTVFAVNVDGTAFSTLHTFTGVSDFNGISGGAGPIGGLILLGDTLYGTTSGYFNSGNGTVFAVSTNGTGFITLHTFTGHSDGGSPSAGLVVSGNALYGTALNGGNNGSSGWGAVFAINSNGTGFTNMHAFTPIPFGYTTNSDGAYPASSLILFDNDLYGTTPKGGGSGNGTLFVLNTTFFSLNVGFSALYSFTVLNTNSDGIYNNSDGAHPKGALMLSGGTLYGTAQNGGASGNGTVFAVKTNGTEFRTLHSFTQFNTNSYNNDGAYPNGGLIVSGDTLYGTTQNGGTSGNGTVFAINSDGTEFRTLHSFPTTFGSNSTNSDGASPNVGLILSGNYLYGTAIHGGSSGNGTVFRLTLPPPKLQIATSGAGFILTWSTNATGFTLQSTARLASPVWSTNSLSPVVVNGQNTVTNPITGSQQFFRLSQ